MRNHRTVQVSTRGPDEVLTWLCETGTSSYCGVLRAGPPEPLHVLAKSGQIKSICQPNALLTFKSTSSAGSDKLKEVGEAVIAKR